jgi:hypothetical protein
VTAASSPPSNSNVDVAEDQCQEQDRIIEENVDHTPTPPPPPSLVYDINHLPHDPSERLPSKVIILMIKMQFIEHIFLKVCSNHMHMDSQKEELEREIVNSIWYGFINIIGLNIVSKEGFCVSFCMLFIQIQQM